MIIKQLNCLPRNAIPLISALCLMAQAGFAADALPQSGEATGEVAAGELPATGASEVDNTLLDLLRVLDEQTELATRTKMNIDFVPGMVSVLHGSDLLARGKRNVFEALDLIPGVELSLTEDGQYQVIVRGVGKTFSSAKIKFLLNGIPFNTTLNSVSTLLIMPLEQVERIEAIRGPGSVIYGEFASVGVINVITYQNSTRDNVFTRLGSAGHSYTIGGQLFEDLGDNSSMTVNFAQYGSKNTGLQSGNDILYGTPLNSSVSRSPGEINNAELDRSFVFDLSYAGYDVSWHFIERGFGDYYGIAGALPAYESKIVRTLSMQGLEIRRPWLLSENLSSHVKMGWTNYVFDSEQAQLFPPGYTVQVPPSMTMATFTEGVLAAPNYVEDKYYLGLESEYSGIHDHDLLLGFDFSKTKQGDTYAERNYNIVSTGAGNIVVPATNQIYTGDGNWIEENLSRRVFGVYVQDQYQLNDRWNLTAGLRYDDYDDVGSDVTPRLAAVYHYSDSQTFKVQYAQSFRPPTFLEMYVKNNIVVAGNPKLKSEQLDSLEFGYIFNNGITILRTTAFMYELDNLIGINTSLRKYANLGKVDARGVELEFKKQVWEKTKLDSNLTYTHAELEGGEQIPGVATMMANLGLIIQPWPNYTFTTQLRYVGDRGREIGDTRADLHGYTMLDAGFNAMNLLHRNLTLRLLGKNLTNEDMRAPAFRVGTPLGPRPPYQDDYLLSERSFEFQLMYEFQ